MVPVPFVLTPTGFGAGLDRLGANLALIGRFREIGSRHGGGLPARDEIESLQRLAQRAGGVPALVAELMPSYSGTALDPEPGGGTRLGGREHAPSVDGAPPVGGPAPTRGASTELGVLRAALAMTRATAGTRRATALAALGQLVEDAATGARSPADGTVAARAWDDAAAAGGAVVAGRGGAVQWRGTLRRRGAGTTARPHLAAAVTLQVRHGVVHGRLGASTRTAGDSILISHWETARRLGPGALAFVRELLAELAAPGPEPGASLVEAASRAGIDRRSLADLHGPIVQALAGGVAALDPQTWDGPAEGGPLQGAFGGLPLEGLPVVPDPLGVVYAVADLTAAAVVLDGTAR